MKLYSAEQIDRANNTSIAEYFRNKGYICERKRSETHIHGFGGFYAKDNNEYYIHSKQVGGRGLISCLMTVYQIGFKNAVKEALDGEQPSDIFVPTEEQNAELERRIDKKQIMPETKIEIEDEPFEQPKRGDNNKRVYAYLSSRGISPKVISDFLKSGKLYQDYRGNAVFMHYKFGEPCGAEFHGTLSKCYYIGDSTAPKERAISVEPHIAEIIERFHQGDLKFSGYVTEKEGVIRCSEQDFPKLCRLCEEYNDIIESDIKRLYAEMKPKYKSFNGVAKGTSNTFFEYDVGSDCTKKAYVFESAIDLMSFMTLHPEINDCSLISMGGLKNTIVERLIPKYDKVVLCVDNDKAGIEFCNSFSDKGIYKLDECADYNVKDYNELLCSVYNVKKKQI